MKAITILAPLAVWVTLYAVSPSSNQKLFAGLGVTFLGLQVLIGSSSIDD